MFQREEADNAVATCARFIVPETAKTILCLQKVRGGAGKSPAPPHRKEARMGKQEQALSGLLFVW